MATPLVAGQAALVRAANPLSGTVEIAVHMQRTASPAAAGEGPPQVDAAAALGLRATERPAWCGEVFLPKVMR